MTNLNTEILNLKTRVRLLEEQLTAFEKRHEEALQSVRKFTYLLKFHNELQDGRLDGVEDSISHILERIGKLEVHCFPGAKAALSQVAKIVGQERGRPTNALDRRSKRRK